MSPANNAVETENHLENLLALSRTLNSSLDPEKVLNTAVESVVQFLRAERGFIMIFEPDGELKVRASQNVDRAQVERYEGISRTVINAASREGKNVLSADAQKDPDLKVLASVQLTGMRSVLCVPLKSRERIIGVIYLDNLFQAGMFSEGHLGMLEAFANQAAVAIENALLHDTLIESYKERLRLMEELHDAEKKRIASEQANQLKSDYVNIVSHELKGPMTIIKGNADALHWDLAAKKARFDDEMKMDLYETISREVDRLTSMIDKLLDVSAIDAGKPLSLHLQETDLKPLIKDVIRLESTSKFFKSKKHTIAQEVPEDLPKILCDHEKVKQVLLNLVENAFKYSPDGGEVKLKVTYDDNDFHFSVSDHGLGISDESQKKLFRKFERLDQTGRTTPGTGLGLYLIRNLIEISGGNISVESKAGQGSTFSFNLPRNPPTGN
jgi:signal transduction histidine kinase